MAADFDAVLQEHRDVLPVQVLQPRVGVDVYFDERDPKRPEGSRHLVAQMAVPPAVQLNLYRPARKS